MTGAKIQHKRKDETTKFDSNTQPWRLFSSSDNVDSGGGFIMTTTFLVLSTATTTITAKMNIVLQLLLGYCRHVGLMGVDCQCFCSNQYATRICE